MTLNEQIPYDDASLPESVDEPTSDAFAAVRVLVEAVMLIEHETEVNQPDRDGIAYRGRLLLDGEAAYEHLAPELEALGFTPLFQRLEQQDIVLVFEGLLADLEQETGGGPMRRLARWSGRSRWWFHLILLLLTVGTTTYSGAALFQIGPLDTLGDVLATGGPFALTLLFILGVHEMGHYFAARYHKIKVTLPFFIPLPSVGLGTLGAVIFIRSPLVNRKSLFDVGVSGPLAGLIVALPLFLIGLSMPPVYGAPVRQLLRIGVPPLLDVTGDLVTTRTIEYAVLVRPMALAAYFGVLLTVMNLLPLGQFDGGHVAYALFGRTAWLLALGVFGALLLLGFLWPGWWIWAFMAFLSGLRHPPPQNDITTLDRKRQIIGIVTLIIFLLILVPVPLVGSALSTGPDPNFIPPTPDMMNIPTPTPFSF